MKKIFLAMLLVCMTVVSAVAQRMTDALDRGLVAVKTDAGVFCSWRILAEEYYNVTYNLYRDGVKVNQEPLTVSNFTDVAGTLESRYTVSAVGLRDRELARSEESAVWAQHWLEITPDHGDLKSTYVPNDACCADVDGDGELEILIKFDNQSWAAKNYQKAGYEGEYFIIEVYKLNGQKLWWIDLGPNMADFQNNEQNIIAYDWDEDGRAEAVMRASDGTVIHTADGKEYVIGDKTKNYLAATNTGQWFVHEGAEFLVYMDGLTGKPYQVMDYPLKRLEAGETNLEAAWGDGYGHRSTKHFFGAPYLDGRHPSIFLARGIYTRHKMVALDVNPDTHELSERWRWSSSTPGSSWYGQGYHNYAIADVDWDGRDEICFGSMVIDDNGHGLSTTGLGHGDAQHHGDFNPYVHGHEIFACNEDEPANNYRNATTSKLYYRKTDTNDDGRCMAGNFTNDYPGAMAFSAHDEPISCVTNDHINGLTKDGLTDNFRIYWDGDLLEECFNYTNGKNTAGGIYKYGKGLIEKLEGSMTNNDTKGTPCYQGDILGDWREEVMMRTKDNHIRIYTTTIPTEWRNYTLWHDHQYRNAMVWQMCGYNQPPHVSYFLGELEGITQAPPPLTMTGRLEIRNGGSVSSEHNGAQVLLAETGDMEVTITEPCLPEVIIDNAPSWVQGHDDNDHIEYGYYTHTLKMNRTWMGDLSGSSIRLVKQGDGILRLEDELVQSYGGPTDVWAGTIVFSGGKIDSHVWLNRFAKMEISGAYANFGRGVEAEYGSVIRPGGNKNYGCLGIDTLKLGFGSVLELDLINPKEEYDYLEDQGYLSDNIGVWKLVIEKKDWQYGPEYKAPVLRFISNLDEGDTSIPEGKYEILQANEIVGNVEDFVIEGLDGLIYNLSKETNADGHSRIYLIVQHTRSPLDVRWTGDENNTWDFNQTENFLMPDGTKGAFVTGDKVVFDDDAAQTIVIVEGDVSPGSIIFSNETKDYTLSGEGSIIGKATLVKSGSGNLTINNINKLKGGVSVEGGTLTVSALANNEGITYGNLGGDNCKITLSNGGCLAVTNTVVSSHTIMIGEGGGVISVPAGKALTLNHSISGRANLEKEGSGTLAIGAGWSYGVDTLIIHQGTVRGNENESGYHDAFPNVVVLNGGTLADPDNIYSYSLNRTNVVVPEGAKASWSLDSRCNYEGRLTGAGTLTVNVTSVRCNMQGDWSQFEGTINFQNKKTGSYEPQLQWNNTHGLPKATVGGSFHNNGMDVSIYTLADKTSVTGSGRTTVDHLDLSISKVKGLISNTYIEVAGTLLVKNNITVALKGSLKVGDEVVLWKCGSLQTSSNLVVNLPELPEGLYWDTSELLKKDGKLKVTDTPTGIGGVGVLRVIGGEDFYDLQGRKVSIPGKGIYIKNGKKIIIK